MTTPKKNEKKVSLPLTEALVLDIVDFLLDNKGYGFSNEISYFIFLCYFHKSILNSNVKISRKFIIPIFTLPFI